MVYDCLGKSVSKKVTQIVQMAKASKHKKIKAEPHVIAMVYFSQIRLLCLYKKSK